MSGASADPLILKQNSGAHALPEISCWPITAASLLRRRCRRLLLPGHPGRWAEVQTPYALLPRAGKGSDSVAEPAEPSAGATKMGAGAGLVSGCLCTILVYIQYAVYAIFSVILSTLTNAHVYAALHRVVSGGVERQCVSTCFLGWRSRCICQQPLALLLNSQFSWPNLALFA